MVVGNKIGKSISNARMETLAKKETPCATFSWPHDHGQILCWITLLKKPLRSSLILYSAKYISIFMYDDIKKSVRIHHQWCSVDSMVLNGRHAVLVMDMPIFSWKLGDRLNGEYSKTRVGIGSVDMFHSSKNVTKTSSWSGKLISEEWNCQLFTEKHTCYESI